MGDITVKKEGLSVPKSGGGGPKWPAGMGGSSLTEGLSAKEKFSAETAVPKPDAMGSQVPVKGHDRIK